MAGRAAVTGPEAGGPAPGGVMSAARAAGPARGGLLTRARVTDPGPGTAIRGPGPGFSR